MIPNFPKPRFPRISLRRLRTAMGLGVAALLLATTGCTARASVSGWISLDGGVGARLDADPVPAVVSGAPAIGVTLDMTATMQVDAGPSMQVTIAPRWGAPAHHRHVR